MTRFEVAKVVGIRANQLSEGVDPHVSVKRADLINDYTYVASLELYNRVLDACVVRDEGGVIHVSDLTPPIDLVSYLNTRDGGERPLFRSHRSTRTIL